MGIESVRSPEAQRYIEGLKLDEQMAVGASEATIVDLVLQGVDLDGREFLLQGGRGALVARVKRVHANHRKIEVIYVEERETLLERSGSRMTEEQAREIVSQGIGGRPDLPPGSEYVERVRGVWRGMVPGGRRAS
jgi:hypothetical protein